MPIDAVNSAMTPLQFARARSQMRSVETSAALSSGNRNAAGYAAARAPAAPSETDSQPHRLLYPTGFHWSYRLSHVNGKRVARRTPQFADADVQFRAFNHVA